MTNVREAASLAERTVQAVARGDVKRAPRQRRKAVRRSQQLTERRVHPAAMMSARLILANGSYTRLELVDENTVIVR